MNIILVLCALILVLWILRLGYYSVVKRQPLDWSVERESFKQELKLMYRVMRRISRYYWRGWHSE